MLFYPDIFLPRYYPFDDYLCCFTRLWWRTPIFVVFTLWQNIWSCPIFLTVCKSTDITPPFPKWHQLRCVGICKSKYKLVTWKSGPKKTVISVGWVTTPLIGVKYPQLPIYKDIYREFQFHLKLVGVHLATAFIFSFCRLQGQDLLSCFPLFQRDHLKSKRGYTVYTNTCHNHGSVETYPIVKLKIMLKVSIFHWTMIVKLWKETKDSTEPLPWNFDSTSLVCTDLGVGIMNHDVEGVCTHQGFSTCLDPEISN